MKQLKLLICIIAAICLGNVTASAQKGTKAIGGYVYGAYNTESGFMLGIDMNYQYGISNYYRIRPHVSLGGCEGGRNYLIGLDNNIVILPNKRFRPYISLGVGFGNYSSEGSYRWVYNDYWDEYWEYWDGYKPKTSLVLSGGIGMDYRLNKHIIIQSEAGVIEGVSGEILPKIKVNIGVAYLF